MDQGAAFFTFQVEMFLTCLTLVYVLITGARIFAQKVLTDLPFCRKSFQMTIHRGLSNDRFRTCKMPYNLMSRNMLFSQRGHILEDALSLGGGISGGTGLFHTLIEKILWGSYFCQYENKNDFHIASPVSGKAPSARASAFSFKNR
jgi:hypothetical protein